MTCQTWLVKFVILQTCLLSSSNLSNFSSSKLSFRHPPNLSSVRPLRGHTFSQEQGLQSEFWTLMHCNINIHYIITNCNALHSILHCTTMNTILLSALKKDTHTRHYKCPKFDTNRILGNLNLRQKVHKFFQPFNCNKLTCLINYTFTEQFSIEDYTRQLHNSNLLNMTQQYNRNAQHSRTALHWTQHWTQHCNPLELHPRTWSQTLGAPTGSQSPRIAAAAASSRTRQAQRDFPGKDTALLWWWGGSRKE